MARSPSGSLILSKDLLAELHAEMRMCRRCWEAGFSVTPGAVFSGPASAHFLIVGQAPGVSEAETGRPFNGSSGQRLFGWLAQAGWDEGVFRGTQYVTAITKCYPGKSSSGKGDRAPTREEQVLCAPFLERELDLVQPRVLVLVGSLAVQRFLGQARLSDVVGTVIEEPDGSSIVPLPHPSGVNLWLNRPENQERVRQALAHLRRLHRQLEPG